MLSVVAIHLRPAPPSCAGVHPAMIRREASTATETKPTDVAVQRAARPQEFAGAAQREGRQGTENLAAASCTGRLARESFPFIESLAGRPLVASQKGRV